MRRTEGQETVFGTGAAQDFQERLGTDKHRFGLTVNRQDKTGVGIFEGVEHFRKIAVKFTTANEAKRETEASDSSRPRSAENMVKIEANRREPPLLSDGLHNVS